MKETLEDEKLHFKVTKHVDHPGEHGTSDYLLFPIFTLEQWEINYSYSVSRKFLSIATPGVGSQDTRTSTTTHSSRDGNV